MADLNLPPSEEGFLKLPQYYGLKVDDIVQLARHEQADSEDQQIDVPALSATGAGSVLVAKICDALARQNYEDDTIRKVGGLVIRNMMTGESTQVEKETGFETTIEDGEAKEVRRTVELMLNGLLDKSAQRSRTVHVNSNEPVLLINGSDRTEKYSFYNAIDQVVQQLQQDWNIWPVRVYAGRYFPAHGTCFSITLLNVVNTDIGGPSMVQLLDEHSEAPEWHGFIRREVWRERDLISREDGTWKTEDEAEEIPDDRSEHSLESDDGVDSTASEQDLAILDSPNETESLNAQTAGLAQEETIDSASKFDDSPEVKHDTDDEEAAFVTFEDEHEEESSKPEELSIPERKISHPTWDRRHDSTSLIDLIRSQALKIPPLGKAEERVETLDKAAAEPLPSEPEQKDEESFIVL